ncbi:6129_t:CDS:2 [Funneliformis caledonium]|uniref:6129_t:CDS:1 n=1 Tax=Funneliformis caledonium TaxID=1117310 RepID=A0A9N9F1R1_9GLOM|nr:6129_t:CDS:2 [Funneliformis caledonium]
MSKIFNLIHDSDDSDVEESYAQICGICKKQIPKYTCPRCNIKYCSLSCYKNEIHSTCTESFYKDSVIEEINSNRIDDDQKQKMFDMLRKFEQENDEMAREAMEQDDEVDDFAERFKNIDLDSADVETILNKLTPAERRDFEQKYIKGRSENLLELADELQLWKPWWEASSEYNNRRKKSTSSKIIELDEDEDEFDYDSDDSSGYFANRPPILTEIKSLEDLTKTSPNPAISLNLLNILYAYAYACRTFNGDIFEIPEESCKVLWDLSPILATKENLAYESISQAIAASSSLIVQNPIYNQPHEFSFLILDDIINLLSSTSNILAALSDLYRLFQLVGKSKSKNGKINQKAFFTEKKIYFYIVYVNYLSQQLGSTFLEALRDGVELEKQEQLKEVKDYKKDQKNIELFMKNNEQNLSDYTNLIEELQ